MAFEPKPLELTQEKPLYSHGFSDEEVERITLLRKQIDKRDILKEPVTLDEFEKVIVPYLRISRTEAFILNPPKAKKEKIEREPKVAKPKVPKEPKVKKLTKKQISERLSAIAFKRITGEELDSEEAEFYSEHTKVALL